MRNFNSFLLKELKEFVVYGNGTLYTIHWSLHINAYPIDSNRPDRRPESRALCDTFRTCAWTACRPALPGKRPKSISVDCRRDCRRCVGRESRAMSVRAESRGSRPPTAYHIPPRFWAWIRCTTAGWARWNVRRRRRRRLLLSRW